MLSLEHKLQKKITVKEDIYIEEYNALLNIFNSVICRCS